MSRRLRNQKNARPYIDRDGIDFVKLIHYLNRGELSTKRQTDP